MIRALTLFVFPAVLMPFFISCDSSVPMTESPKTFNENILRYDVNAPFTSLNPTTTLASGSNNVFPLLYSFLFVPNPEGELEPDLAIKWTYDSKDLTWTIHLRDDAKFHNNQMVRSKDVKYTLENRIVHADLTIGSIIDRISLISATALCVHLKKKDPLILERIWGFGIIPHQDKGAIDYYNHPIGSGPFKFKSRNEGKEVCLTANDDFYDGRPSLEKVIFYYQPNREKAWTRLLRGETDIAQEVSPKNYEMIEQYDEAFYFDQYTLEYYTILLYNTHDPLFSDPRVRRALTQAIDREYIVTSILDGYGKVANGPMGVDSPYHNPEVLPFPYNPEKALALLKQAGWTSNEGNRYLYKDGKHLEFTILLYKEYQTEKKVAQYIKLCLNEIGIRVKLQTLDFEALTSRYLGNTEFQAVLTEILGAYREPERIKNAWAKAQNAEADAGSFSHPEVSRLLQRACDEKNLSKQKALFYEVDSMIISLQPGTFLFQKSAVDVMSKRFNLDFPFRIDLAGIYRLKNVSVNTH
jgi:peptide/nickel transport system substrate-binding protein